MSKTITDPQDPYVFWRMEGRADDATPRNRANADNFELDEISRLQEEIRLLRAALEAVTGAQEGQGDVLALQMLLDDLKTEFAAVYAETPPVFQGRWVRVARMLGVEQ